MSSTNPKTFSFYCLWNVRGHVGMFFFLIEDGSFNCWLRITAQCFCSFMWAVIINKDSIFKWKDQERAIIHCQHLPFQQSKRNKIVGPQGKIFMLTVNVFVPQVFSWEAYRVDNVVLMAQVLLASCFLSISRRAICAWASRKNHILSVHTHESFS